MSYVAECEQCGVLERGDLEAVGDAAEDHEQFHDVRVERVVTDGGQDIRSEWTLVCTDCDWKDKLVTKGHPRDGPPSEVDDRVREHKGTVDWSHVVRAKGRVVDETQEIDPSLLTDGGQSVDDTERSDDPHADDFCVVCGRHPEPGLTMHPVASIENGTVCEVCTHAV